MDPAYAERYDDLDREHWWFGGRRAVLDALWRRHMPRGRRTILDLGSGPGGSLPMLAPHGEVTAVDLSHRMANIAIARGYAAAVASEGESLALRSASFDVVVALDVIEHVDDDAAFASEMYRVCKPGGYAVVTVPAYAFLWGPQDVLSHHRRRYTATALSRLMRGAAFEVVRLTHFNTLLFPAIAIVRLAGRLRRRADDAAPTSDFERLRGRGLDAVSRAIFSFERRLVPWLNLPFGVSIACIGRKPE